MNTNRLYYYKGKGIFIIEYAGKKHSIGFNLTADLNIIKIGVSFCLPFDIRLWLVFVELSMFWQPMSIDDFKGYFHNQTQSR